MQFTIMQVFSVKLSTFVIRIIIFLTYCLHNGADGESLAGADKFRGVRSWRKNTNFENADNWEGLVDANCSSNIFSFPGWMDTTVVSWPTFFIGKQIILPVNGHFVFQPGVTTLSDKGKSDGSCQRAREVKFRRTSKSDWFDPRNWDVTSTELAWGQNAIPHVERVPCQFDVAKFSPNSTFSINIPQNVSVGKFLLGEKVISYTDIAIMMTSQMGKLQWKKETEVDFNLTNLDCKDDDDSCICNNYQSTAKQRICSLAQPECLNLDEEHEGGCTNPLTPHGFCCPICGFHIKIKHTGSLQLGAIGSQLKSIRPTPSSEVDYFVSRFSRRNAHVILVPATKDATESALNMLGRIVIFIKSQPQVEEVTWIGSWNHGPSDVDKWTSEGLSGGTITFLVLLTITALLAVFCFIYYKQNGSYPPLTLPTISNLFPSNFSMPSIRVPSMQMPNINIGFPGRRGSTQAGGRTFGFARFSNERVSTMNIERSAAETPADATVERGELVDDTIQRIDSASFLEEKVTQVSPDSGFTNVTYDLVGVSEITNEPEQSGMMELVSASGSGSLGAFDIEASPPPPKPIRIGTGILELTALNGAPMLVEPVYSEVVDALHDDVPQKPGKTEE